jgi:hypothetical protein
MPRVSITTNTGAGYNTERYIKITTVGNSTSGKYSMLVSGGNGTGVAVDEPGITTLVKGTTSTGFTINPGETK